MASIFKLAYQPRIMYNTYTKSMSRAEYRKCLEYANKNSNGDWKNAFNEKAREIWLSWPINKNLSK